MNKQRVMSILLAAGLASTPVSGALAEGFYFGISGGAASFDLPSKAAFDETYVDSLDGLVPGVFVVGAESSLDDSDQAWGVQVGYRWGSYVAAELGYVNFGEALYRADVLLSDGFVDAPIEVSARVRSSGPTLAVLGILPLRERFDIHARAGVYFSDTRYRERFEDPLTGEGDSIETDGSDKDLFAGLGAAWNINESYAVRLEYQRFFDVGDEDHTGEENIDLLSVGFLFR